MLIDKDGEKKGVVSLTEAIRTAEDASLDLVQVSSSDSDPVVCKILDYGKHMFSKKKSNSSSKVKVKKIPLKRLSLDHLPMLETTI